MQAVPPSAKTDSEFDWRGEVERICSSHLLAEAQNLQALLRYLAEKSLLGQTEDLKEFNLGQAVFHRKPDYDPRLDAVVRVQASQLRKRLEQYYQEDGRGSRHRIQLPRGAYVLRFEMLEAAAPPAIREEPSLAASASPRHKLRYVLLLAVFVTGCAAGWWFHGIAKISGTAPTFPELWAPFLKSDAGLICVYGVPQFFQRGAILMRDTHVNSLADLRSGLKTPIVGPDGSVPEAVNHYTGVGELRGMLDLAAMLHRHGKDFQVRAGHELSTKELESNNVVLVSSARFRSWIDEESFPADFVFEDKDAGPPIVNKAPRSGERVRYERQTLNSLRYEYALVSLWLRSNSGARLLTVRGAEEQATGGATVYLVSPGGGAELRQKIGTWDRRAVGLQVIVQVDVRNDQVQAARYVTHHWIEARQGAIQPGR